MVRTIRLNFGEHSSVFQLQTESLVQRRIAITQVAKLHDLAKAFIDKEPAVLDEQAPAACADPFPDIGADLPILDWDDSEFAVPDLSLFVTIPEAIPDRRFEPFDVFSLVENRHSPKFMDLNEGHHTP
jgi:hypothetical protein